MRVHLKGVHSVNKKLADGSIKTYYYHRATGTRLEGEPGSPEFIASFTAAEKSISDRHAGTFNALVRDYTTSIEFEKLSNTTKTEYRRLLTAAEVEFDDMPIGVLNDPGVRQEFLKWRDKAARINGARQADYRLQTISAMLTWGVEHGKITTNHLKGSYKRLYHSDRSQIIWTQEHIDAFMKVAPIELQRAMILALDTGQRQGDLLRLRWDAYDGKVIRLKQSKTGQPVPIPCTARLREMLDGMEQKAITILTTAFGKPFKKRHFISLWNRAMAKAGLEGLHFHDLRGTAITRLAEAGASVSQIAAISGHTMASAHKILEQYLARTETLAHQAIAKLEQNNR